jgi:hypothetical protein
MDITSLILIVTVALLTAAFLFRPFLFNRKVKKETIRSTADVEREHLRSSLLAEKDRVLSAIQELEFDHTLHKIPEDLYPAQRAEMIETAAGILKKLDVLGVRNDAVERNVQPEKRLPGGDYDEVEALIARHRSEGRQSRNEFCPHCGKPIKDEDKFCPKCGKSVQVQKAK